MEPDLQAVHTLGYFCHHVTSIFSDPHPDVGLFTVCCYTDQCRVYHGGFRTASKCSKVLKFSDKKICTSVHITKEGEEKKQL